MPPVDGENDENEEIRAQNRDFAEGHRGGAIAINTFVNYYEYYRLREATKLYR